jgi:hypothetical protein
MNDAEKAAILMQDAATATPSGRRSWTPYIGAVATYRAKRWSWLQIWQRMAALGLVPLDDQKAFESFRATMSRQQSRQTGKLEGSAAQ